MLTDCCVQFRQKRNLWPPGRWAPQSQTEGELWAPQVLAWAQTRKSTSWLTVHMPILSSANLNTIFPTPQINFKNRTKKLHSAALCHRQDERALFKSSFWEVPVLLGSSILGCLYFNRGRAFDQRREYEVPYHHPTYRTHRPDHTPPSCSHKHSL